MLLSNNKIIDSLYNIIFDHRRKLRTSYQGKRVVKNHSRKVVLSYSFILLNYLNFNKVPEPERLNLH